MRRKILGFLLLALVVCAGIVFVELKSGGTTKVATAHGSNTDSVLCVVLGGSPPLEPDPDLTPRRAAIGTQLPADDAQRLPRDPAPPVKPLVGNDPPEPNREPIHSVRSGDSLSKIAQDYFGTKEQRIVERIAARNAMKVRDAIHAGTKLVVPVERFELRVASGTETIADIAFDLFGSKKSVAPLIRFNPSIGSEPTARPPKGTRLFIPR
jgi:hypothetical protein